MQLDPVNNEDHTQHVMQWACPRRGPAHQQRASYRGKTAAHAQSVPRVCNTSWECGRETLSLSIHDKANERTPEKESGRRGPRYGASQRPQKMIHARDVRGGKGSLTWENMVYPREPQVRKGEIRCVGEGVTIPPPYLTEPGARYKNQSSATVE